MKKSRAQHSNADLDARPLLINAVTPATLCGHSLRTWRSWDATGRIPESVRIGGSILWRLYIVAACTGLRASELAGLTPERFRVNETPPTVTVLAAYSKHRRQDVLHPSVVEYLRPWLAGKKAATPVWPGTWARAKRAGKILQKRQFYNLICLHGETSRA